MVDHLDALIERLGDDKVGLGSDFDGATMPEGVRDVSLLPNLLEACATRGYDDATHSQDRLRELATRDGADLGRIARKEENR